MFDNNGSDSGLGQLPNESEELIPASFPNDDQPIATTTPAPDTNVNDDSPTSKISNDNVVDDDLIDLKKNALEKLTPLVGQLDQTAEDKFKTTMMMIQASDDKSLLRSAYESALKIEDDKYRAQALLDVVNEINYFTHPTAS